MAQRNRFSRKQHKKASYATRSAAPQEARRPLERKPPTQYGKPFILLEDIEKNTFEYASGAWVPYALTIAQCREEDCQVKALPQKVNGKTRYEIRSPLPMES
jgi:hypothetical protein